MVTVERSLVDQFNEEGYVIYRGLLDWDEDLKPVWEEYTAKVDDLIGRFYREGRISSEFQGLPFGERLGRMLAETGATGYQPLDISLPQKKILPDTEVHTGPAAFGLLRNPKLLDAVEMFVGPEIYSNPVQHVRIKPPEKYLPEDMRKASLAGGTFWHQDQGVVIEEADNSDILTVWLPLTDAHQDNGTLAVSPWTHRDGLILHCPEGIPEELRGEQVVAAEMEPGDVLFQHKLTKHGAFPNVSYRIRWSFDLRYQPIGQPTGRPWFPGFVARSRSYPESEFRDWKEWSAMWLEARDKLSKGETPRFKRWTGDHPLCA